MFCRIIDVSSFLDEQVGNRLITIMWCYMKRSESWFRCDIRIVIVLNQINIIRVRMIWYGSTELQIYFSIQHENGNKFDNFHTVDRFLLVITFVARSFYFIMSYVKIAGLRNNRIPRNCCGIHHFLFNSLSSVVVKLILKGILNVTFT